ncbi:unnamed protein product [Diplocarpon coronariae]
MLRSPLVTIYACLQPEYLISDPQCGPTLPKITPSPPVYSLLAPQYSPTSFIFGPSPSMYLPDFPIHSLELLANIADAAFKPGAIRSPSMYMPPNPTRKRDSEDEDEDVYDPNSPLLKAGEKKGLYDVERFSKALDNLVSKCMVVRTSNLGLVGHLDDQKVGENGGDGSEENDGSVAARDRSLVAGGGNSSEKFWEKRVNEARKAHLALVKEIPGEFNLTSDIASHASEIAASAAEQVTNAFRPEWDNAARPLYSPAVDIEFEQVAPDHDDGRDGALDDFDAETGLTAKDNEGSDSAKT